MGGEGELEKAVVVIEASRKALEVSVIHIEPTYLLLHIRACRRRKSMRKLPSLLKECQEHMHVDDEESDQPHTKVSFLVVWLGIARALR